MQIRFQLEMNSISNWNRVTEQLESGLAAAIVRTLKQATARVHERASE